MMRPALTLAALLLGWVGTAPAQLISIRTVPVSQAHQFEIFPSLTLAMGGVSIAVADSLLDPFTNPAKGAQLGATRFFGSPSVYSVSSQSGGGRTLPLGALMKAGSWYGGLSLALQEVDLSRRNTFPPVTLFACPACEAEGIDLGPVERSHGNTYLFAMAGREFPAAGLSLGGSILWSRLNAVDGVDLLYAGSARLKQFGHAVDVRLGLVKEWAGDRSLEALVLHNRFGTTHDVFYLDTFWDPGSQQVRQRPRLERNLDQTRTWGFHVEYEHPLPGVGWRLGWLATVNRMDHPKIPNYEIMNIPRDPGHSSAFNVGIGIARGSAASPTFGIDLIYEPIWSYTWADAEAPIETRLGGTIPAGGKTIENRFRFSNALLRMGFGEEVEFAGAGKAVGLQLGLAVRSIHYWLAQRDNVQVSDRDHEEAWVEWTPTWGLGLRFPTWALRYQGRVTKGTGRPGVALVIPLPGVLDAAGGSNILVAPSGPLTLDEVTVVTHQVSLSLPLR
jgi:hypothetical protein